MINISWDKRGIIAGLLNETALERASTTIRLLLRLLKFPIQYDLFLYRPSAFQVNIFIHYFATDTSFHIITSNQTIMKLRLLFLSLFSLVTVALHATTLTITVKNYSFTPADATINLGDTILFSWVNGEHTTTSTGIPSGAASWDRHINSANTSYTYVPTVAGTYNYQCTPHVTMGHVGKFTVNGTSSISDYNVTRNIFEVYPNPAQSVLNISLNQVAKTSSILITDITGKQVIAQPEIKTAKLSFNIGNLPAGVYFVRLIQDGKTYTRKFAINK